MYKQKAPIYKLLRSKAPKYRKFRLTHIFETNQLTSFMVPHGRQLSSRSNFANLGSFAKVSVPVASIIPCTNAIVFLVRVCVCVCV